MKQFQTRLRILRPGGVNLRFMGAERAPNFSWSGRLFSGIAAEARRSTLRYVSRR